MSDPRKTLQTLFRRGSKLVPFGTSRDSKKARGWLDVEYGYAIVSGSRKKLCNRAKFVWAEGKGKDWTVMSHETKQYLLKCLIWVTTSLRTIMRGKSARVGSGFVAESPRNPFPPFQLPTRSRLVGTNA